MSLVLIPLPGIPNVIPGDDLVALAAAGLEEADIYLADGDILVFAQKVVSKAENRVVDLKDVEPSLEALELAGESQKDPRLVELILSESKDVLRVRPGLIIVEHRLGFVCANAGIDRSNVEFEPGSQSVLLLPENPQRTADNLRAEIFQREGVRVGILIIDSHGRAWRMGTIGTAIGVSGFPALVDLRGEADLYGYQLENTLVGVADELAGAASLVMGQAAEGVPIVLAKGFPYRFPPNPVETLLRPKDMDLFR